MKGQWRGWWEQDVYGRQEMYDLIMDFSDGQIEGQGVDCIGVFTFEGHYDENGVDMVKHYVGRHDVIYRGQFDGEGAVFGKWFIPPFDSGNFAIKVVQAESEAIRDMTPRKAAHP